MKSMMKRTAKDEKGSALPLVLVLLVVGGLVLTPLLGLMSTGLVAGRVYEEKMDSYYAADAGVEDAIWKIKYEPPEWQPNDDPPNSYVYEYPEPLIVDGRGLDVVIYKYDWDETCGENLTYRIISTVITDDSSGGTAAIFSGTAIDAHLVVSYMDFSSLLDYAIVSNDTIDIQPHVTVNGSVWLPYEEGLSVSPGSEITGDNVTLSDGVSVTFPTFDQLSTYYLTFVDPDDPYPHGTLDISITKTLGPCYRYGNLAIDNTGDPDTLVLEGTIYIDNGSLDFNQAGSHNYTIDLSGETIFVDGEIDFASNAITISGSGCIIARGDIDFQPSISSSEDDFVLVMSVEGTVNFQPGGDLTGCVVGNLEAYVSPDDPQDDFSINWIPWEGEELNFPTGVGDLENLPPVTGTRIKSWEID